MFPLESNQANPGQHWARGGATLDWSLYFMHSPMWISSDALINGLNDVFTVLLGT